MSDQGNMLETRQLSKSFGGVSAVKAVDLRVAEGELHAIIGPNGAGKTTLFHLLTGVYPATSGQVLFRGRDITAMPANQRVVAGMSRSYQRTNIFPNLTVEEKAMKGKAMSAVLVWLTTRM